MSRLRRPRAPGWRLTRCLRGRPAPGRQAETEASHPEEAGRKPLAPEMKSARRLTSRPGCRRRPKGPGGAGRPAAPSLQARETMSTAAHPRQEGRPTSGEAGETARRRAAPSGALPGALPGGPARCPQGLSESVQTRGSGGPPAASRSGLGHRRHCQPAHGPVRESPAALGFSLRCF